MRPIVEERHFLLYCHARQGILHATRFGLARAIGNQTLAPTLQSQSDAICKIMDVNRFRLQFAKKIYVRPSSCGEKKIIENTN